MRAYDGLILRILMVAALLCAQFGGIGHGISHLSDHLHAKTAVQQAVEGKPAPAGEHCDLCDGYAQIASAIGAGVQAFVPERMPDGIEPAPFHSRLSLSAVPFAARAPPRSA